ncbi:SDR family NAD(P)-dependent oxidoreductase [Allostreptomyces psammosilenae]|uniref:Short-chain dehydrogenase n=1 Tax=Allostreptomyces psammosilenae TaxID=1892865 RepID=A0A852ZSJ1_9ACTN|nr:SDR family NAD(P)-dependent oxidoreductase [Allostreptomyces psammosilenae]NYI04795.1 hypothetical protein [Allostreptomyces psammosilenae]
MADQGARVSTALVTGASGGIGEVYADRLAGRGHDLVLVARDAGRLREVAGRVRERASVTVEVLPADLSDRAGVAAVAERAGAEDVELLVNNAGINGYGPFTEVSPLVLEQVLVVNALAPTLLARAAVPGMVARRRGAVINVASLLAFSSAVPPDPLPHRAAYVGTKSYLVALTRTLAAELAGSGVALQVCCPGLTATDFHRVQGVPVGRPGTAAYRAGPRGMDPADVVTASLAALDSGEVVCVPGLDETVTLTELEQSEARIRGASGPVLADRYRP